MILKAIRQMVGIPAPKYLQDDPWFGPAIISDKQQREMIKELEKKNLLLPSDNQSEKEVDNIHEIMYNLSTQWTRTLGGGSEQYWH